MPSLVIQRSRRLHTLRPAPEDEREWRSSRTNWKGGKYRHMWSATSTVITSVDISTGAEAGPTVVLFAWTEGSPQLCLIFDHHMRCSWQREGGLGSGNIAPSPRVAPPGYHHALFSRARHAWRSPSRANHHPLELMRATTSHYASPPPTAPYPIIASASRADRY